RLLAPALDLREIAEADLRRCRHLAQSTALRGALTAKAAAHRLTQQHCHLVLRSSPFTRYNARNTRYVPASGPHSPYITYPTMPATRARLASNARAAAPRRIAHRGPDSRSSTLRTPSGPATPTY